MSSTSTHDLVAADYEGRLVGFAIPPLPRAADEAAQRAARQPIFAMVNHAPTLPSGQRLGRPSRPAARTTRSPCTTCGGAASTAS